VINRRAAYAALSVDPKDVDLSFGFRIGGLEGEYLTLMVLLSVRLF
jgi:hypothetical protein